MLTIIFSFYTMHISQCTIVHGNRCPAPSTRWRLYIYAFQHVYCTVYTVHQCMYTLHTGNNVCLHPKWLTYLTGMYYPT